jgi:hypothetical protein
MTAEGDRAWQGWHDSELDMRCSAQRTVDGVLRCAPENWNQSDVFYTDAACTAAVYTQGLTAPCEPMNYIMRYRQGDCTTLSGYEYYELGASASPSAVYTLTFDGVCTSTTLPTEPLYLEGAPVSPQVFVAMEPFEADSPARVRAVGYLAEDGTRQVSGWKDTTLGVGCQMQIDDDSVDRCFPYEVRSSDQYSDQACSMPLAQFSNSCNDELTRYATSYANPYCMADAQVVRERGAMFTGTRYELTSDEICQPATIVPESPLFETTPVAATTFQEIGSRVDESDPGRLKPSYYTTGDGGCWFSGFWDSELEIECSFTLAEDGVYRCLPEGFGSYANFYTDAACTTSVKVLSLNDCENKVVPEYVLDTSGAECETAWAVFRTSPVTGALYRILGAECEPIADVSALSTLSPVDPTMFMGGELRVE